MKTTYGWLKDFVEIKIPPQALAEKLTMVGLEVTSSEIVDGDFVLEIEITSNRSDWLSVIGIAREVAAITGKKLKLPKFPAYPSKRVSGNPDLAIEIENKLDCPLYTAKIIREVKVGSSPDWLKNRLESIGLRSINNIVDITNYVLFETGEPLHAFDLDKLIGGGKIIVRRAKAGEKITTIDGEEKNLDKDILVIADENKPVAIAGVMGGKNTEVTDCTKNILLEAASFNPVLVRRGRQKLGLQTDSSYRFERGVDLEMVSKASARAAELIELLASGKTIFFGSCGTVKAKKVTFSLDAKSVEKILGIGIAPSRIKSILNALGFKVKDKTKNKFSVEVPSHRPDVNIEADLVEEVSRIYGYAAIPSSLPAVLPQVHLDTRQDLVALTKEILIGLSFNEAITYSLIDRAGLKDFPADAVEIRNPLSKEQEILRPKLIPSLLRCVAHNLNQKQEYVNLFEVASVFLKEKNLPKEELTLSIVLCGKKPLFLEEGRVLEEASPLNLKGALEVLLEWLGIKDYEFSAGKNPVVFDIKICGAPVGYLMQVNKAALDALDIKNKNVFALEVSLEKIFAAANLKKKYSALPKYPAITRDISFILKDDVAAKNLLDTVKSSGAPLLKEAMIADYYKGKQIPEGFRGLTVSCTYRLDERTLTEAEITPLHTRICENLTQKFGAKLR